MSLLVILLLTSMPSGEWRRQADVQAGAEANAAFSVWLNRGLWVHVLLILPSLKTCRVKSNCVWGTHPGHIPKWRDSQKCRPLVFCQALLTHTEDSY